MSEELGTPKVFVSYSWKPEKHKDFVKKIADRLIQEAGIEVILDRYELNVGDDKYAFMERMVTDTTVNKVLIFSNKIYAQKANDRKGGVGTESTIISKEVYSKVKQDKFIPIVLEKDDMEEPYFPVFMQSRIYIDFSKDEIVEEEYERLVRFIYNKPIDIKPALGKPPKYLIEKDFQVSSTHYKVERIKTAVSDLKPNAIILIEEYYEYFFEILSKMKIEDDTSDHPEDEKVYNMIIATKHLRNEFLEVFETMLKLPAVTYVDMFHRIVEQWSDLIALEETYYNERQDRRSSQHYKFLFRELFMYIITIAIKKEKFELVASLTIDPYYIRNSTVNRDHRNFTFLDNKISSIDHERNQRLKTGKKSLSTNIFIERMDYKNFKFDDLYQTDRLLNYLALIQEPYSYWQAHLTMWDLRKISLMKKAESRKFFDKVKVIFGVDTVEELKQKIESISDPKRRAMQMDYYNEDIFVGLNVQNLAKI